MRCRVLSVRESSYQHPLPNSERTIERPQLILICIERPRRGAQHREDVPPEGEDLASWDGRSPAQKRKLILREEWTVTRAQPGDYVHCVGNWEEADIDETDEAELRYCDEQEQYEQTKRDLAAESRPFSLMIPEVKKEEPQEEDLPPASFESNARFFADLDEAQLLTSAPPPRPRLPTMYLTSASPLSDSLHADNLLILHPDTLVTATAVCDVPTCIRKPLVKHRINGTGAVDKMSESVVMGNMLHEVLQACLTGMGLTSDEYTASQVPEFDSQESLRPFLDMPFPLVWYGPGRTNFALPFVLKQIRLQVLNNLEGLLCCNLETSAGEEKLLELCRPFGEFARKYLEDNLAANRTANGGEQMAGLFRGRDGLMNMADIFKDDATIVDSRTTVPTLARVTHVFDVEEEIWSPMYGLKGKIDVSVEVELQETHVERPAWRGGNHFTPGDYRPPHNTPQAQTSFYRRTQSASATGNPPAAPFRTRAQSIMPMEIKTGRSVDALEHRAQTMLYTLMMSDRYGTDVDSGLLYYSRSGDMHRVRRTRNEVRGLIVGRNELAYWLRHNATTSANDEESPADVLAEDTEASLVESGAGATDDVQAGAEGHTMLPPTIDNERECNRCFAQDGCMLYRRAVDRVIEDSEAPSEIASLYDRISAHLSPEQAAFYAKWERLLSLEESDMVRYKRELWTLSAAAREELGRCFANMIIDPRQPDFGGGAGSSEVHAHTYRFVRDALPGSPGQSLLGGNMSPGDPCVVSIEPHTFSVAQGYIIDVNSKGVVVGLDHHLDAVLERAAVEQGQPLTTNSLDITFRIDRDEYSDGMAKIRFALSRFFFSTLPRDQRHRELIVDLKAPKFRPEETALSESELPVHLNEDQRAAMRKVCATDDYALILGMPGTGKTTTIAELIRLLVSRGNTILLASYTHSAVDTIMRKLLDFSDVRMLRLGNIDRVHADLQHCTLPRTSTVEELNDVINTPNVVGTTCLSTGHATFARRTFDYCIIDEASQITLPSTLGSLRFADKFVLVGDHYQLPPLVRNDTARAGGLDISLFKRLHEAHPASTVYLTRQYRMNESIMMISNHLIYNGQLKCGNDRVAKQALHLPFKHEALHELHKNCLPSSHSTGCAAPRTQSMDRRCWLDAILDEKCQAVFVDTDDVPGRESRRGRMVQNEVEAGIIQQIARALVLAGVTPRDIAVITPYRQQLKLLQQMLLVPRTASQQEKDKVNPRQTAAQIKRAAAAAGSSATANDIEVLTADRAQGRDKAVVLLSLVRSNELGARGIGELLNDWRRINVALTRAQRKVVIVGSQRTLSAAPLLVDFFGLMKDQRWILKLPPRALEMHPEAAREPCSPRNRKMLSQNKVSPAKRTQVNGNAAATGFVRAASRQSQESHHHQSKASTAGVLEEIQPLSQSSQESNKIKEEEQAVDFDHNFVDLHPVWAGGGKKRKFSPSSASSTSLPRAESSKQRGNNDISNTVNPRPLSSETSGTQFGSTRKTSFSTTNQRLTVAGEAVLKGRSIIRDALRASHED